MKHLGATAFAGMIFLVAGFFSGLLPVSFADVSPGTGSVKHSRETPSVKQGVSRDGSLAIEPISEAPAVPPWAKSANFSRTLRTFVAPNRGGVASLFVESVKPHEYYVVAGAFRLTPEYAALAWPTETTVVFYGTSPDGQSMRYAADLHRLLLSGAPIDETPPTSPPNLQSSGVLP